jgi:hypothetical protein
MVKSCQDMYLTYSRDAKYTYFSPGYILITHVFFAISNDKSKAELSL